MGKWLLPLGVIAVGALGAWAGWKMVKGAAGDAGTSNENGVSGFRMGQVALEMQPDYIKDETAKAILMSL